MNTWFFVYFFVFVLGCSCTSFKITHIDDENYTEILRHKECVVMFAQAGCIHCIPPVENFKRLTLEDKYHILGKTPIQVFIVDDTWKSSGMILRFLAFNQPMIFHIFDGEVRNISHLRSKSTMQVLEFFKQKEWMKIQPRRKCIGPFSSFGDIFSWFGSASVVVAERLKPASKHISGKIDRCRDAVSPHLKKIGRDAKTLTKKLLEGVKCHDKPIYSYEHMLECTNRLSLVLFLLVGTLIFLSIAILVRSWFGRKKKRD